MVDRPSSAPPSLSHTSVLFLGLWVGSDGAQDVVGRDPESGRQRLEVLDARPGAASLPARHLLRAGTDLGCQCHLREPGALAELAQRSGLRARTHLRDASRILLDKAE